MSSSPSVLPAARLHGARRFATSCGAAGISGAALLALLFLPLVGCGKKGDPMPAPRTIPQAATDLKVRQRGLEVVAEFAYPKATVAGLPLPGLDQVTLYVLDRPVAAAIAATPAAPAAPEPSAAPAPVTLVMPDAREFAVGAKPFLALSGAELASAISGDRITVRYRLVEPLPADLPARIFSVRTHAAGGELSDWSNLAGLLPRAPAASPASFTAVAAKNGIDLAWSPSTPAAGGVSGGVAVAGYNVYRRDAARTSYGEPVATLDADVRTSSDASVTYGRRYIYALTAIGSRIPLAESALSSEVEIDYQDRFAPVPPGELSALGSVGEVRLVWPASPEPDVAGYVIERADPDAEFHRVNAEPVNALEFTDRGLASGFTFRYRVAAIDKAGNLGPAGEPVATRVP